ncbi:MAG: hypothetical protein Q8R90_02410 [Bacteroidales bacterium]|nr:hypothetical protein [Bacteroidales bacterium]
MYNHVFSSIHNNNQVINNEQFKSYIEKHNLHNENIFVVRYSFFSCYSCVKMLYKLFEDTLPDFKTNKKVLIIVSGFKKEVKDYFSIKIDTNLGIGLPYDETGSVYVMIVNNFITNHFFEPDKANPGIAEMYIGEIKRRYFLD